MSTSERVPSRSQPSSRPQPRGVSMAQLLAAGVLARAVSEPPAAPPVVAESSVTGRVEGRKRAA